MSWTRLAPIVLVLCVVAPVDGATVRVRVEQTYRVKDGPAITDVSLPVEVAAVTMLRAAGRQIADTADATLTIRIEGVTTKLVDSGKHDHYMNADVAGEIVLATASGATSRAPFSASDDRFFGEIVRSIRRDQYASPRDAPFLGALLRSTFVVSLAVVIEGLTGVDRSDLLVALVGTDTFGTTARAALRDSSRQAEALSRAIRAELDARDRSTASWKRVDTLVVALAELNDERSTPLLITVVQSRSVLRSTRTAAVAALGRWKTSDAALPIVAAVADNARMRGWSVLDGAALDTEGLKALQNIGDRRAIGPLITLLKDHLAQPPGPDAMQSFVKRYTERAERLVGVLQALSGQTFGKDIIRWTSWWDAEGQRKTDR